MKKILSFVFCFLLLFNFSKCVPEYRTNAVKEIVLPEHIRNMIRKDVERDIKKVIK